jgi:hypothetical protein
LSDTRGTKGKYRTKAKCFVRNFGSYTCNISEHIHTAFQLTGTALKKHIKFNNITTVRQTQKNETTVRQTQSRYSITRRILHTREIDTHVTYRFQELLVKVSLNHSSDYKVIIIYHKLIYNETQLLSLKML